MGVGDNCSSRASKSPRHHKRGSHIVGASEGKRKRTELPTWHHCGPILLFPIHTHTRARAHTHTNTHAHTHSLSANNSKPKHSLYFFLFTPFSPSPVCGTPLTHPTPILLSVPESGRYRREGERGEEPGKALGPGLAQNLPLPPKTESKKEKKAKRNMENLHARAANPPSPKQIQKLNVYRMIASPMKTTHGPRGKKKIPQRIRGVYVDNFCYGLSPRRTCIRADGVSRKNGKSKNYKRKGAKSLSS